MVVAFYKVARTVVGLVLKPYETYRAIVNHGSLWELIPLSLLIFSYLIIASAVKTAAFRPYMLTKQFVVLAVAVGITYGLVVGLLWIVGRMVGGRGNVRGIVLGWAYTLVPTVCWFLVTSILYMVIPPPRTEAPLGILFSLLFLLFSSVLFFWKLVLSYLTLRFSLKIDLFRIVIICAISIPIIGIYSLGMYQLGIFKIPFI